MISDLFPRHCVFCNLKTHSNLDICQGCIDDLPLNQHACTRCAQPVSANAEVCGECLKSPPPWDAIHSPFLYESQVKWLIQEFKYHQNIRFGKVLRGLLLPQTESIQDIDQVIPVPLHHRRLIKRGMNQSLFLSQALNAPLMPNALVRAKPTKKLAGGMKKHERTKEMKGAFVASSGVKGQRVLLVDDVMTTGATLASATNTLLKAGASKVEVLIVARAAMR